MKKLFAVVVALVSVLALVLVPAAAVGKKRKPPHVTYNQWVVTGTKSGAKTAKPGATVTMCGSEVITNIDAVGRGVRLVKHQKVDIHWIYNGQPGYLYHVHWTVKGRHKVKTGISSQIGYPAGSYLVKLTHGGKTEGSSKIQIVKDSAC